MKTGSKKTKIRALGLITGGGDCPGLNAAIRAVTKRAELEGIPVYGVREGFRGLYEGRMARLKPIEVSGIVARGGTILGTSRFNPLKDSGSIKKIRHQMKRRKIDVLINIGGEGTMRLSHELDRKGIRCIGVPKTIDNDVWGTDLTFGFDTAVSIATEAIDRLHTNAESHNRVMIVEVMGRHAGWIATYAGIAGGADAILIPEKVFPLSRLVGIIRKRERLGKRFSIIVVSEDARILTDIGLAKAELLHTPMHHDEYGNLKLGGISHLLERELRRHLDMEIRSTVLGYIQRGGSPTAYDRVLASRLGVAAAELALNGKSGRMVALQGKKIGSLPLSQVVKKLKAVDEEIYRVGEVFFG
jgi:ATP-dependent phosphofructokinase / diphosphate-dependent phosphofructokinase